MKIITALLIVCFSTAYSQEVNWYQGSVVLKDKAVLRGELSVEPAYNLVLFRDSSGLIVYPAHKISSAYYHDTDANINRKFISLTDNKTNKRYALYEKVFYGEILVVRKVKDVNADPSDHANSYRYFVWADGQLISFRDFKATIFTRLSQVYPAFADEVSRQNLDPSSEEDVIPIIKLYTKQAPLYAEAASAL